MKKELWQPHPEPVTVIRVDVDDLIEITELLQVQMNKGLITYSSSYQRDRRAVIDWHVPYGEDFTAMAGEYLIITPKGDLKVLSHEQLNNEYAHVTSQVTLEADEGNCRACGQEMLKYKSALWHRYSGRTCPAERRGISKDELFVPKNKES